MGPDALGTFLRGCDSAEVVFTAAKTETTFRLTGKLSHVSRGGVGFVFGLAPPFEALLALQEKARPNPWADQAVPDGLAVIHRQCLQALENALYPLVDTLPAQIQAGLLEQASSLSYRLPPFDAVALERQTFEPLVGRFYAHALEQAKSFVVPDLSLHPEPGAIYTEAQHQRILFDDWMNLVEKIIQLESKHEDILRLLESRFSVLVQRDILSHDNPFGPNVLCYAFHYALQGSGLDNHQRKLVYEIFSRLLDERLGTLYDNLRILSKPLDALTKASHELPAPRPFYLADGTVSSPLNAASESSPKRPEGKTLLPRPQETHAFTGKTDATATQAAARLSTSPSTVPTTPKVDYAPYQHDAFATFVLLFRYAESQANKESAEALDDCGRAAVITALRKLQTSHPGPMIAYFDAPRLHDDLSQILAETGQEKILSSAEARENLQILGLLLDAMLRDIALLPSATPYLKRLQIPLLIASFADRQLLHDKTHPAWEILNLLDCLAQAANPQGEIDNAELRQFLDTLCGQVADEVADNPDAFAMALDSLKKQTAPLLKAYRSRLERVAETCEGGQRLEHARRRVEQEIDARIGGKTVPLIILSLLDIGWRQLLVLTHLRLGADNDDWRRQLAVIDLLMAWLANPPPANPPSQFNIQWLLNFTGERLADISTDPIEALGILEKIQNLLPNEGGEANVPAYVEVPTRRHFAAREGIHAPR